MDRVSFYTLGCKLNLAETGSLQREFVQRAFDVVPFGTPADVTVINTCSVTEEAERKCRQTVRRARRANPDAFIVVTGCYAQLRPEAIAALPGVDVVLGAREKFQLFALVDSFTKRESTEIAVSCIDDVDTFGPAASSSERSRAVLKVQDGCDYSCSFCTIPLARGRSRSQSIAAAVDQAHGLAEEGFREVILSGVNVGLFGREDGTTLLDLVRALDRVDGIERYRISSIEPNLLTDELIDFVAGSRAFLPHFHVPLQSGDDAVLGAMRRRYRRHVYAGRVDVIRSRMPDACIGADVIVGFPGETEERFANTVRFIEDLDVSYLHVFTYSERPDTAAVDRADFEEASVPPARRSARNRRLRLLSEKKRRAFYESQIGTVRPVLWEGDADADQRSGFTDNYVRVSMPAADSTSFPIESVRLVEVAPDGTMSGVPAHFGAFTDSAHRPAGAPPSGLPLIPLPVRQAGPASS